VSAISNLSDFCWEKRHWQEKGPSVSSDMQKIYQQSFFLLEHFKLLASK